MPTDELAADVIKIPTEEAHPEHAEPPVTNIGDVYKAALAKEEGKEPPPAKKAPKAAKEQPVKPVDEPEIVKEADTPPEAQKKATKPVNALDAALGDKSVETKKDEPEAEPEILKEFPKDAKKPNWERAREVMGKQATELQTLKKEREQLQREREEAKVAGQKLDPETEKKLKEYPELIDAITAVNLELLPEFRKEFVEGRKALVTEVSEEVRAYGGDSDALVEALSIPKGRRRDEAIELALGEDVTEVGKSTIRNLIAQIDVKDRAKAKMIADPQHSFESYQARVTERTTKAQQEASALRQSEIGNVIKTLPELSPLLKPADSSMPDAKEWNEDLEKIVVSVPKDLGPDATLKESAILSAKGRRFDFVERKLIETYKENVQLKKQLAEYDGAQPEPKGSAGPKKTGLEAELEKTPGQIFVETMAREQGNPIDT